VAVPAVFAVANGVDCTATGQLSSQAYCFFSSFNPKIPMKKGGAGSVCFPLKFD
jgi:hypothetical protein